MSNQSQFHANELHLPLLGLELSTILQNQPTISEAILSFLVKIMLKITLYIH